MTDLTVIFITANKVPQLWADYHRSVLLNAIGDSELITISRIKTKDTTLLDIKQKSYSNIYYQMLQGAKIATKEFIAIAEDDTLYTKNHFFDFRPRIDEFAYNRNRWSIFTWGEPSYSIKDRISNCSLIAPKKLMIEALTERFTKHPEGSNIVGELGKARTERHLRVTVRNRVDFFSNTPIVQFNHDFGTDEVMLRHTKKRGMIRAYDIPVWRKAEDLLKKFI